MVVNMTDGNIEPRSPLNPPLMQKVLSCSTPDVEQHREQNVQFSIMDDSLVSQNTSPIPMEKAQLADKSIGNSILAKVDGMELESELNPHTLTEILPISDHDITMADAGLEPSKSSFTEESVNIKEFLTSKHISPMLIDFLLRNGMNSWNALGMITYDVLRKEGIDIGSSVMLLKVLGEKIVSQNGMSLLALLFGKECANT